MVRHARRGIPGQLETTQPSKAIYPRWIVHDQNSKLFQVRPLAGIQNRQHQGDGIIAAAVMVLIRHNGIKVDDVD